MPGSPPDLDGIGTDELKRLLLEALEKIAAALRAEIARLKGLKGTPVQAEWDGEGEHTADAAAWQRRTRWWPVGADGIGRRAAC